MPITVQGPGGVTIDFPEGTDASTIDGVMRQKFGGDLPDLQAQWKSPIEKPGAVSGYVDQAIQGVPVVGPALQMGGAAAAAAVQPMLGQLPDTSFGQRYDANLGFLQDRTRQFAKENPAGSTAAALAGALGGTLPAAGTQLGARALGLTGSLPARILQGGMGGAALGSTDAALRGESPAIGGSVGGAIGSFGPLGGKMIGAGVQKVGEMAAPLTGPVSGYSRGAVNKVTRALADDSVDPATIQQLGPQGMLLDMGPNLRSQGEALATQPGSASRIIGDATTNRFKGAGERITQGVDETLGPYQNFRQTMDKTISDRKTAGNALYQQAFENARPVDVTPALKYIDDTIRPGLSRVAEGGPSPDSIQGTLSRVRSVLSGDGAQRIDARDLHVVKMDLDDSIEAAVRAGKNNQARVLTDVRNRVVDSLDSATDDLYREARTKFRSDSSVINALDDGRDLFKRGTRPDDLLEKVKGMSEAERAAFKIGSRDAIDEVMGNVKNDALAARTLFGKDWNQRKLEAVIGRDQAAPLLDIVERENKFAETYGAVQRGSQTRGRMAAGEEFPNKVAPTNTQFVNPTTLGFAELLARKGVDMLRASGRSARLDTNAADAARLLTAQGPEMDQLVEALRNVQQRNASISNVSEGTRDLATVLMNSQQGQARKALPFK